MAPAVIPIGVKLKAAESVSGETLPHLPFHAQTGLEAADPEGKSDDALAAQNPVVRQFDVEAALRRHLAR